MLVKVLLQVQMRLQMPWFLRRLKRGWLDSHCLLESVRCLVQSTSVVLVLLQRQKLHHCQLHCLRFQQVHCRCWCCALCDHGHNDRVNGVPVSRVNRLCPLGALQCLVHSHCWQLLMRRC